MMTLDEAIRHAEEIAEKFWSEGVNEEHCRNCGFEHAQLAEWLKELKARRGEIEDKVVSAAAFMEKVQHEAKALNDEDSYKLLMWAEWIMDKTPDIFTGELDPERGGVVFITTGIGAPELSPEELAELLRGPHVITAREPCEEDSVLEEITINGRTYLHKRHPITDPIFEEDDLPFPEVLEV